MRFIKYRLPMAYVLERAGIDSVMVLCICAFIIVPLAAYLVSKLVKKRKTASLIKTLTIIAFIAFVVYETILVRRITQYARFSFIPFSSYRTFSSSYGKKQILSNILLFVQLGFLINWNKRASFKKILIVSFAVSLFIEFNQLVFHTGVCEIDDLMHNILGGCVGHGYFRLMDRLKCRLASRKDKRIDI